MAAEHFEWLDYAVFGVMLLCSALIGVYFAFFAKQKQNTTSEYLMGGKTMGIFPISMSLIASYISGVTLLGVPAEMYIYGTQFWTVILSQLLVCLTMAVVYLPVFYKLQITSTYEYLNLRFSPACRLLGSIFFLIMMLVYIPVVIYVPALAFNQVTGFSIHFITPIVCCVVIFYTTLGGLKAVVWTDALQTIVMFGGVIVVMILGINKVGGMSVVIQRSLETDRIEFFNFDPDPRIRHTFWTMLIGGFFNWLADCSVNQAMVQRCLAMPTLRKANISLFILAIGTSLITSLSCICGLVIYAYFYDCDPVTTKMISKADQVLPYFVMKTSQAVPGLPGLFVAGVFSAALSSMSTGLNSMAGVIFEDMIRPMLRTPMSEARASTVMKVMSALLGAVCVALVFIVEHMGALVQMAFSLTSVVCGPLIGMFTLGMFFPWANEKGALAGGLTSFCLTAWMSFGGLVQRNQGLINFPTKELRVDGCAADILNHTVITPFIPTDESVSFMYRISYQYYVFIGCLVTLVVGNVVSFLTGPRDIRVIPRDLLTPIIHRFLPRQEPDTPLDDNVKFKTTILRGLPPAQTLDDIDDVYAQRS